MVSALLGFMAISGLMGQRNLKNLQVTILPGAEFFAGLPGRVDIQLTNGRKRLPAFLIEVTVAGHGQLFPALGPGQKQRLSLPLTMPTRGYHQLPETWVTSRFPVNFFIRSSRLPTVTGILVFPTPLTAFHPAGGGETVNGPMENSSRPGIDGELRSIDSYHQQDPLKAIHWKLSARHDDYKVKRQNRHGTPAVTINPAEFTGSLEQQISQATFIVDQLIRSQSAVGLRLGEILLAPESGWQQRTRILKELALYGRH